MKKLILIVLAFVTIQVSAQELRPQQRQSKTMKKNQRMNDFTPEQNAQLKSKKMALELDLTAAQQKQIEKLNLENAEARKTKMTARKAKMGTQKPNMNRSKGDKLSKEDRYNMMNERLDMQMEMKEKMKKILNDEQFAKWEKLRIQKQRRPQGKMSNRKAK